MSERNVYALLSRSGDVTPVFDRVYFDSVENNVVNDSMIIESHTKVFDILEFLGGDFELASKAVDEIARVVVTHMIKGGCLDEQSS